MNKYLTTVTLALFASTLSITAEAKPNKHKDLAHTDIAQVVNVSPVYHTVEHRIPKETCWTEVVERRHHHRRQSSSTPALIGGLIGGAIGHELGHGSDNKKIGAVVGSILGMSVGSDIERSKRRERSPYTRHEEIERCEISHVIETEEIIEGYDVRYRYHGRIYETFMHEHPGRKIRVAVNVRPL